MVAGRLRLNDLYESCGHDHEIITLAAPGDDESLPDWLIDFLKAIHSGELEPGQIDEGYFDQVRQDIQAAVAEGLGGKAFGADNYRNTLKAFLDQNVCAFSAARSLYENDLFRSFLTDAEGNLLSESKFIAACQQAAYIDNVNYLKIDRAYAITCAQAANQWEGLQAFSLLEYRTSGFRVCPICGGLNGTIAPPGSPIWAIAYIPNHIGCNCLILPAAGDAEATDPDLAANRVKAANIPDYARKNVGIESVIYDDNYPYIEKVGSKKLTNLDAVKNYRLRAPEKIYDNDDLPSFKPMADKEAANAWWEDMAGDLHGSFDLTSADGLSVTFDDDFRFKTIEKKSDEDRYRFIAKLADVLQNPDEVWSNRYAKTIQNTYIKYYKDAPVVLGVEAQKEVRAITLYELKKDGKINFENLKKKRKGILKYKAR